MSFEWSDYDVSAPLGVPGAGRLFAGRSRSDGRGVVVRMAGAGHGSCLRNTPTIVHEHVAHWLSSTDDGRHTAEVYAVDAQVGLTTLLARRTSLTVGECVTVLLPVARGLAAWHAATGLQHGCVDADHIVVESGGRPVLLPAALPCAVSGRERCATGPDPRDLAPEVARGQDPDAAADLFALGALALRCATGRRAWPAQDRRDVIIQSTAGQWPDPGDELDSNLSTLIRALLDAVPERRPSAAEAATTLARGFLATPLRWSAAEPDHRWPAGRPTPRVPTSARRSAPTRHRHRTIRGSAPGVLIAAHRHHGGPFVRPMMVGLLVLFVLCGAVGAGLWWGRRGTDPVSVTSATPMAAHFRPSGSREAVSPGSPRAGSSERTGATAGSPGRTGAAPSLLSGGRPPSGRTGEPRSTPAAAAPTTGSTIAGRTPVTRSSGRTAATGPPASTEAPGRSAGPARPTSPTDPPPSAGVASHTAPIPADWSAVVRTLDHTRALALVRRDDALLDRVYLPGSSALRSDLAIIGELQAAGLRVNGAEHQLISVRVRPLGQMFLLTVTDLLPTYRLVDDSGHDRGAVPGRGVQTRVIEVQEMASGYRIAGVEDPIAP